jgi:hypothetical protein
MFVMLDMLQGGGGEEEEEEEEEEEGMEQWSKILRFVDQLRQGRHYSITIIVVENGGSGGGIVIGNASLADGDGSGGGVVMRSDGKMAVVEVSTAPPLPSLVNAMTTVMAW